MGERLALYVYDGKEGVWLYDKWGGEWVAVNELVTDMLQKEVRSVKRFMEIYKQFDKADVEELAKRGAIEYLAIIDLKKKSLIYISWFDKDMDEKVLEYIKKYGKDPLKWKIELSEVVTGLKIELEDVYEF